ncbi:MAG: hypothetical protein GYB31_17560 [Bacteroidetes bacterium]|nr:hypothetical protein [Bacteroidota bacterium]
MDPDPQDVTDDLTSNNSGEWIITSFIEDDNDDETSKFSGYTFTFEDDGTATATVNGNTTIGSWSDGNDDSTTKLVLFYGNDDPLEELNDDWRVLSSTDEKIELTHVSGGDGSTDFLTFER